AAPLNRSRRTPVTSRPAPSRTRSRARSASRPRSGASAESNNRGQIPRSATRDAGSVPGLVGRVEGLVAKAVDEAPIVFVAQPLAHSDRKQAFRNPRGIPQERAR